MDFCRTSGMQINETKTKFMVINGSEEERQQMTQADLEIKNCDTYTYLGMAFSQDGKLGTSMKTQCKAKMPHVVTFESFIKKNQDMPYEVCWCAHRERVSPALPSLKPTLMLVCSQRKSVACLAFHKTNSDVGVLTEKECRLLCLP
jgi:hypothetical protein